MTELLPIRYQPNLEALEADEHETIAAMSEVFRSIQDKTFADSGHAIRAVHAKCHGAIDVELTVLPHLPTELAQGLFATPGRHKAVMRFSTTPGDLLDDSVSAPRGLALKIMDVEGARLPGAEGATTQDLVLVNGPAFSAANGKSFLKNLKLLAATTDRAEGVKKVASATFRAAEALVEVFGGKSGTLLALGGQPLVHVLGDSFYSQTPFLYGDYVAKFAVVPVSPSLTELTGGKIAMHGDADALRHDIAETLAHGGEWELQVQLLRDLDKMPVEDASVAWPEDISPYVAVARIVAPPQPSWDTARATAIDEGMAFSPWHGLAAHRPLGSINRMRQATYQASARFRGEHNDVELAEPGIAST